MPPKTGGERSGLRFKCLQGSAAGTENAAPLAVPGAAVGGRSRLGLADRCAKRFLLHLPRRRGEKRTLFQMLPGQCGRDGKRGPSCGARRSRLGLADRCAKRFLLHLPRRRGEKRTLFQMLPGQCGRDGKRGPSCGARRGRRRAQPPRLCRPLRQKSSLHPPQAAVGFFARAFRRSGPNPGEQSEKPRTNVRGFFWRRRRDLNPRAGFPTYALSRGASSTS